MFAAYCLLYCVVLALGSDSCAVCSVLFGVCCAMVCSWRLFGVQIRSGGCVVFAFDADQNDTSPHAARAEKGEKEKEKGKRKHKTSLKNIKSWCVVPSWLV